MPIQPLKIINKMIAMTNPHDLVKIGIVSISDRASMDVQKNTHLSFQVISYKIKFVQH